jgi:hypothetical protein
MDICRHDDSSVSFTASSCDVEYANLAVMIVVPCICLLLLAVIVPIVICWGREWCCFAEKDEMPKEKGQVPTNPVPLAQMDADPQPPQDFQPPSQGPPSVAVPADVPTAPESASTSQSPSDDAFQINS